MKLRVIDSRNPDTKYETCVSEPIKFQTTDDKVPEQLVFKPLEIWEVYNKRESA